MKLATFCLSILLMNAVLVARVAAQSNDAANSSAPPTSAQEQAPPAPDAAKPQTAEQAPQKGARTIAPRQPRKKALIDDRVRAFAVSLNLTEAQQAAVKKILEQRQAEILRLRTDTSISGSERIDRLHLLQDQTVNKIRSVLDDEQKKKYDPLAVRKVPPSSDQKSVEDWLKETTPH